MNPDSELITLFETTLRPRIVEMIGGVDEGNRLAEIGKWLIIVPWVVFVHFAFYGKYMTVWPRVAATVVALAAAIGFTVYGVNRFVLPSKEADSRTRSNLQNDVVAPAYRHIFPGADYAPMQGIAAEDFVHSGLFRHNSVSSNGRVSGRIGEMPFTMATAVVSDHHQPTFDSTGHGYQHRSSFPLHGPFFRVDLPRALRHVTVVQSKEMPYAHQGDREGLRRVTIEDAAFGDVFEVFIEDTDDARPPLTPPIRDAMRDLGARSQKHVYLALRDDHAYLALDFERPPFLPEDSADTVKEDLLLIAALHRVAVAVASELERNTSIWK